MRFGYSILFIIFFVSLSVAWKFPKHNLLHEVKGIKPSLWNSFEYGKSLIFLYSFLFFFVSISLCFAFPTPFFFNLFHLDLFVELERNSTCGNANCTYSTDCPNFPFLDAVQTTLSSFSPSTIPYLYPSFSSSSHGFLCPIQLTNK